MTKVTNISDERQAIPGVPAFGPGETQDLPEPYAKLVLRNPNFAAADAPKKETTVAKTSEESFNGVEAENDSTKGVEAEKSHTFGRGKKR